VNALVNLDSIVEAVFGPLDPASEWKYFIEIDGLVGGSFSECSGIRAEREVQPVKEGGRNYIVHKLPGRTTYGDITLRKGVMFSIELWEWMMAGNDNGKVDRYDMTIIHYSNYFNLPARWYNIYNCYPVAWELSSLRADSNALAMESVTLTFERFEPVSWSIIDFAAKFAT
jgi:phage tail-like protein